MEKVYKEFSTRPDQYGFKNQIEVRADYDPETHTVDNLEVNCYSHRKGIFIDITDIFELPLFSEIIDSIDWHELYRKHAEDKAAIDALSAELEGDEIIYKSEQQACEL